MQQLVRNKINNNASSNMTQTINHQNTYCVFVFEYGLKLLFEIILKEFNMTVFSLLKGAVK